MTDSSPLPHLVSFFQQFPRFHFDDGEIIVRKGEITPKVYFLDSGIVAQKSLSHQGQEVIITLYKPGAFFPLIWALPNKPVPYDLSATTECTGWAAPREKVVAFLQSDAEVTYQLALRLLSGLEGLSRKVEYSLQATAHHRLVEALVTLAYRFAPSYSPDEALPITITHQYLAELTGLSRETVSREIKILRQQKLIQLQTGKLILPDLRSLEKIIDF